MTRKADTSAPLPPPFAVGTRVRYLGDRHVRVATKPGAKLGEEGAWIDIIAPGIEVVIADVHAGRRGTGRALREDDGSIMIDDETGEPYLDETSHGYSVYRVGKPVGRNEKAHGRCIRAECANEWEVIS